MMKSNSSFGTVFAVITFLLLGGVAYYFVSKQLNEQHNPNQHITANADQEIRLKASSDGHFRVSGLINGTPVTFLVDTGASGIAINAQLAKKIGLKKGVTIHSMTANGETTGWLTIIDNIDIAGINITRLPASILPNLDDEVLLGMGYLKYFDMHKKGQQLILTPQTAIGDE